MLTEQTAGSGKTLAIVTIVGRLLGLEERSFDNIRIAAPTEQFEESFVCRLFGSIRLGGGQVIDFPEGLLCAARVQRSGSTISIRFYLESPSGHAIVTTHAVLVGLDSLPQDCRRKPLRCRRGASPACPENANCGSGVVESRRAGPVRHRHSVSRRRAYGASRRPRADPPVARRRMSQGFTPRSLESSI